MHAAIRAVLAIAIMAPLAPPAHRSIPRKDRSGLALPADQDADLFARLRLGRPSARSQTLRAGATKATSRISRPKWRSGACRSPTWRRRSRISRRRAVPTRTPSFCSAFAAAFEDLSQQRSQVNDGLERFGHKQNALANRIRSENEAVQKSADEKIDGQAPPGASNQDKLLWDIRVYNDRHQSATYVCEVPTLIEQRIGAIARAVQQAVAP